MSLDLLQDTKILETHMIRGKGEGTGMDKRRRLFITGTGNRHNFVCLEMKNGFASVQSSIL